MYIITIFIIVLNLFFASPLKAEAKASSESNDSSRVLYTLDEVVVYGSRGEYSTSAIFTIPRARIEQQVSSSIAELMKPDPGLVITSGRKNSSDLSIRGANSQSALILIDGCPMNSGYFGGADLSLIPVNQIEKVQIIKGPASVRYGANSLGGIVNIITSGGAYVPPQVTVNSLFGDLGHRELSGSAGGSFGNYTGCQRHRPDEIPSIHSVISTTGEVRHSCLTLQYYQ